MYFLIVSLGMVAVLYGYCGWRLLIPLRLHFPLSLAAWLSLAALALLPHVYLFAIRGSNAPDWLRDGLAWIAYLGLGFATITFCLLILRDLGWLLWLAVEKLSSGAATAAPAPGHLERREHLLWFLNLGVVGISGALAVGGVFAARRRPAVVDVTVPIADLPPSLEGFRIAQITDIHVGPTIKRDFVSAVVDIVNDLEADLIAFTGDLADGSVHRLRPHVAPLSQLRAAHGCYFVTGNHEYYSGVEEWVAEVGRLGMQVLINEHRIVRRGEGKLVIAGVTDWDAGSVVTHLPHHASDPGSAFEGAPQNAVRLLLAHQPRSSLAAAGAGGFDLMLCGHTHGGQLLPWRFLVLLQQPFISGLHRVQDSSWVYVSKGAGYWGPPMRLGAPSEITHITLKRA